MITLPMTIRCEFFRGAAGTAACTMAGGAIATPMDGEIRAMLQLGKPCLELAVNLRNVDLLAEAL